ncbi:MAG: DMT family transporter [Alteromonadaceae bacterium]|nr:DMT family transporter [Alteromonadaceae bacterium]
MASSFVVSEIILPYSDPVITTCLRFTLASIVMMPFMWKSYSRLFNIKILFQYSIISLLLVLFFLVFFESLKTTSAMRTSVIYTLLPLLSVVITYVGLKLITPKSKLLGFVLGTVGAAWVLIIFNQEDSSFYQWHLGDGIFLIACCCMTSHVMLIKNGSQTFHRPKALY